MLTFPSLGCFPSDREWLCGSWCSCPSGRLRRKKNRSLRSRTVTDKIHKRHLPPSPRRAIRICCICFEPTLSTLTMNTFGYSSRSRCHERDDEITSQCDQRTPIAAHGKRSYDKLQKVVSLPGGFVFLDHLDWWCRD